MFIANLKGLALTFVFALTIALALATASEAKGYDATPLRRDHGNLKRLIRKRAPQNLAPIATPIGNPPADPRPTSAPPPPPVTSSAEPTITQPIPSDTVAPSASIPATTEAQPLTISPVPVPVSVPVNSIASPLTSASVVLATLPSTSSILPSVSTIATTSLPPPPSSSTPPPQPSTTPPAPLITTSGGKSTSKKNIVTLTSEVSAASATATGVPAKNAQMQKTVTTVLIVVASVVGGTAIIWTIIRKWKFSPSNSFEDRMQPIDWQPTNDDSGLPVSRRLSSASSFHSAGHGRDENMGGVGGVYGPDSDYGHGGYGSTSDHVHGVTPLQPVPDHDFTAAPSTNLAPVGVYADLSRGSSPGPQMQEAYSGHTGYHRYGASQEAYDYNGVARY